jgi:hypothetical protein
MVLSFKVMRLSIGSVVVVLVAQKGSVWMCRFFAENTIRHLADGDFLQNRRPELAHPQNTDLPLPPEQQ